MEKKKIFVISINPKIHEQFKKLCKSKHTTISKRIEDYMILKIAENDSYMLLNKNK